MRIIVELPERFARVYDEVMELEDRLPEIVVTLLRLLRPLREKLRPEVEADDLDDVHIW